MTCDALGGPRPGPGLEIDPVKRSGPAFDHGELEKKSTSDCYNARQLVKVTWAPKRLYCYFRLSVDVVIS